MKGVEPVKTPPRKVTKRAPHVEHTHLHPENRGSRIVLSFEETDINGVRLHMTRVISERENPPSEPSSWWNGISNVFQTTLRAKTPEERMKDAKVEVDKMAMAMTEEEDH